MSNKDWLNDLKVDDKVFIVTEHCGDVSNIKLRKITRITPTRRLVVDNLTFINGVFGSNYGFSTTKVYLEQVTQESLLQYKQNKFKRCVLNKIKLLKDEEKITFEQANRLNDILNLGVKYESIEY